MIAVLSCYSNEPKCRGGACDWPEVAVDDAPAAPTDDTDGDGTPNANDTDDDGDGIDDTSDVDVDGDDLLENQPPDDVVDAARTLTDALCEAASGCCSRLPLAEGHSSVRSEDLVAECRPLRFPSLLSELTQAATTAGAATDLAAWETEGRNLGDSSSEAGLCPIAEKGPSIRIPAIEEVVLPYFHGTRAVGSACQTRWDCVSEARCDGLAGGSATCGPRPREGGDCVDAQPHCPSGITCSISEEGGSCERPNEENDFCHVFDLDGVRTDDCDLWNWCDDTIETPACRPVLREGDACQEDRVCEIAGCDQEAGTCAAPIDIEQATRDAAAPSCAALFPSYYGGS